MSTNYFDHLDDRISTSTRFGEYFADTKRLLEWRLHLLAVHWCDSEVCNGGFHQFFRNSTGVIAPEALPAFEAIGRPDLTAILRQAMDRLSPDYPRDETDRQKLLESDRFDRTSFRDLDDQYYALRTAEQTLANTLNIYARQHATK